MSQLPGPEATAEFQKIQEISHGEGGAMALGHALAVSGRRVEALKIIEDLKVKGQREYVAAFWLAMIYAGLDEKDQAFEWLEKSLKEHDPNLLDLKVDPRLDSLRSDPRFGELLRRMKLS